MRRTMAAGLPLTEGYDEEARRLCRPEHFTVRVDVTAGVWGRLTAEQQARLTRKMRAVEQLSAQLACGMLKGTLKYPNDDWDRAELEAELEAELLDVMNYRLLLKLGDV